MGDSGRWGGYAKAVLRGIAAGIPIVGPAVAECLKHAEEKKLEAKVDALVQRAARGEKNRARSILSLPEDEVEKAVAESVARMPQGQRDRLADGIQGAKQPEDAVEAAMSLLSEAPAVRHSLLSYACRRIGDGHVLAPGDRIDARYEVIELVGAGGMGAVYRARDLDLDEDVVVKFLRAELAKDGACARRFVQEAKVGLSLTHEGIVRIRDVRKSGETSYLTMEWVDGPTLRAFLGERGALPWKDAEPIVRGVLGALAYAHGKGVLHLDLKPENVLLPRPDAPKLCDFGLARVMERAGGASLLPGAGTPHYMAPEQQRGDDLDARADVFAAGVMLYEMLTGELPVGMFEPLPEAVPLHVREGIQAALSQKREKRPKDAAALLQALGEAPLEVEPVNESPKRGIPRVARARLGDGKSTLDSLRSRAKRTLAQRGALPPTVRRDEAQASPTIVGPTFLGRNDRGFEEYENEKDGCTLILVPAGQFVMGSKDFEASTPPHRVTMDACLIGKTPVTNAQYRRFCEETGAKPPLELEPRWGDPESFTNPDFDDHPVVGVTWEQARAYAQWAGGDLPSEAQWEKAAGWEDRAGRMRIYPWGAREPNRLLAVFGRKPGGGEYTVPVGSIPEGASPCGALDMAGNVSEWCLDYFDRDYYGTFTFVPKNPVNDRARSKRTPRVTRGGSWSSKPVALKVAVRGFAAVDGAGADVGFRIARRVTTP